MLMEPEACVASPELGLGLGLGARARARARARVEGLGQTNDR